MSNLLDDDSFAESAILVAASRIPAHLRAYWLGPEGSARVGGWGNEGSYRACVRELREEGVPKRMVHGECANLYFEATGRHPGAHNKEHSLLTADGLAPQIYNADIMQDLPEESAKAPDPVPAYAAWEGILTVEGVESGDGRLFALGSLDWAQTPLKLMYQQVNAGGHKDSVLVGQITHVARKNNQLYGWGFIDLAAQLNGVNIGAEVHRLMEEEFLNGVSVDVDKVKNADVTFVYDDPTNPVGQPKQTIFQRGRVRGATLVAFPAFVEAQIYLTGEYLTASAVLPFTEDVNDDDDDDCGCGDGPLVAAAHSIEIPDLPPAFWFNRPTDVQMKGALTVTDEGRVYGLLAPRDTTHRARKVKVPTKNVDYSRWMGKETIVAGGGRVVTGVITAGCGHAPTENFGTLNDRITHYDNSCSIVANVAIGEHDGEVWVAGALHPFATAEQVSKMLSCTLSGDWQPHPDRPGVREFIAALLVPVPGFAMARTEASVVYDEEGTLVASAIPVVFEDEALSAAMVEKEFRALTMRKNILATRLGGMRNNV